jgi:hypothetical protein
MPETPQLDPVLALGAAVVDAARARGVETIVIGAVALAAHGYSRATEDLDLAVAIDPARLKDLAEGLRIRAYAVELRAPDPQDPLGGVIDVQDASGAKVQVVNFDNPPGGGFPELVRAALPHASELTPGSQLKVVDPIHLVAFKLYAGGPKSKLDILELLQNQPGLDRARLREVCASLRLHRELEEVLRLEGSM